MSKYLKYCYENQLKESRAFPVVTITIKVCLCERVESRGGGGLKEVMRKEGVGCGMQF